MGFKRRQMLRAHDGSWELHFDIIWRQNLASTAAAAAASVFRVVSSFLLVISCCCCIMERLQFVDGGAASYLHADPNYPFLLNATEAPLNEAFYDYIIVGGGTTGCPLAATLSQNFTVLLLERGGKPYGNPLIEEMTNFETDLMVNTSTSPAQSFFSEDGNIPSARARVLGGGSCLNAGFFTYANPEYVASMGWDGKLVNESYAWVTPIVAEIPDLKIFQSSAKAGLLEVGVVPDNGGTFQHLIGTKVGGSIFDKTGRRHTAADLLQYANPDRITVLLWANTQRVLFKRRDGQKPRAVGVVYTDLNGVEHKALLNGESSRSEVILSAGALGSPQLLLLSGIGPADQLAAFNIPVVLNQTEVGKNMADNPSNVVWLMTNRPVEISLIQVVGITNVGTYIEVSSGEMQEVVLQAATKAMARGSAPASSRNDTGTAAAPHIAAGIHQQQPPQQLNGARERLDRIYEAVFSTPAEYVRAAAQGGILMQKVKGPYSHGELRLLTANVSDNPSVRFNYYQRQEDLDACTAGVRIMMKAMNSQAFAHMVYTNSSIPDQLRAVKMAIESTYPQRFYDDLAADTASINQWCKETVQTIWHYHGGVLANKVVDSKTYHVLGTDALRVIDGSTFNFSPGTNPQATCMMLGRYMGVQILRERLGAAS